MCEKWNERREILDEPPILVTEIINERCLFRDFAAIINPLKLGHLPYDVQN